MVDTVTVYQLDVCTGFTRIGECKVFDLMGRTERNQTGEWQVTIPDGGVEFGDSYTIADVDSIILWDIGVSPSRIAFAGAVIPGDSGNGISTNHSPAGTVHTLSGVGLFGILSTRLAYPDPSTGPPWGDVYDTRTGRASTVAGEYISHNLGSNALTERQIPDVTIVDPVVGTSVTWTARLQPLSTLVTTICNSAEIICKPRMPVAGEIVYSFTAGRDRTDRVVISDQDITSDITVTAATARASFVLAGGSGEGTSRTFETADSGETGLSRAEWFYDVSTIDDTTAVALAATGGLADSAAETAVDFGELLPSIWRLGTDFEIGDIVNVEVDSVRYPVVVDGIAFQVSPSGSNVRPILGRTTNNEVRRIMRKLWGTDDRFNSNIT